MGPVINQKAVDQDRALHRAGQAGRPAGRRRQAPARRRATSSSRPSSPTSTPSARIAQEEIFGPFLAVIRGARLRPRARDRQRHRVRPDRRGLLGQRGAPARGPRTSSSSATSTSTASRPARWSAANPFGGFNLSGTDSKAGGYDYLLLFVQAKSISRKLAGRTPPTTSPPAWTDGDRAPASLSRPSRAFRASTMMKSERGASCLLAGCGETGGKATAQVLTC